MKKNTITSFAVLSITAVTVFLSGCTTNAGINPVRQSEIDSLRNQITQLTTGNEMIAKNLVTFDTLDFTVFSNQEWTRLHESH